MFWFHQLIIGLYVAILCKLNDRLYEEKLKCLLIIVVSNLQKEKLRSLSNKQRYHA